MALSMHSVLTVCHQHGVDFRLEDDKILYSGDIGSIGKELLALIKARKADGGLKQFFLENPAWVPGKAPQTVSRAEPEPPTPAEEAKSRSVDQALSAAAAAPATEAAPAAVAAQGSLPLSSPPTPPPGPPSAASAAAAPVAEKKEVHRVGLLTDKSDIPEEVHKAISKRFTAVAECVPCRTVFYEIDPAADPDPLHCLKCGSRLKKPGAIKAAEAS